MLVRVRACLLVSVAALAASSGAQAQVAHRLRSQHGVAAAMAGEVVPESRTLATLPAEALAPVTITLDGTAPAYRAMPGNPGPVSVGPAPSVARPARSTATAPAIAASGPIRPENYGINAYQSIYHYSDSLVGAEAQNEAPQRFSGWFKFTTATGLTARCTASLISRSILVTAGHCVHMGGTGSAGWIRSGTFYPAYRNGESPLYGSATASGVVTTSGWYSQGALDQGYDVGLVVLNKRTGTTTQIGDYTGWFGACFHYCLQNFWHTSQLGFPANYYAGQMLTESEHLAHSDGRDYVVGSGMQGGSSGGPHVTNLGALSDSSLDQGQWPTRNIIFAVTSWGYVSDIFKIQGASSLSGPKETNHFPAMFNYACAAARALHGQDSCTPV